MKVFLGVLGFAMVVAGCSQPGQTDTQRNTQKGSTELPDTKLAGQPPDEKRVTLHMRDADVKDVFALIARESGKEVIVPPDIKGTITASINNVPWNDAVSAIAKTVGCRTVFDGANTARIVRAD